MKCSCDVILPGTICVGGISTVTVTSLQYIGYINDWRMVVGSSVITFVAVLGYVIRKAKSQLFIVEQKQTKSVQPSEIDTIELIRHETV